MEKKEKYLTVQLFGKNGIRVNVFKNKDKPEGGPDFVGNGVAIWINTKKEETPKTEDIF